MKNYSTLFSLSASSSRCGKVRFVLIFIVEIKMNVTSTSQLITHDSQLIFNF